MIKMQKRGRISGVLRFIIRQQFMQDDIISCVSVVITREKRHWFSKSTFYREAVSSQTKSHLLVGVCQPVFLKVKRNKTT
ncbi:hypothetical protein RIR_jg19066.t1 [Rhizophagus irregularis DAOM 181602=DAOM 197198]|nr:hypothetical protein RIR_jg19066.t1 [Rhizophagus irregularis DAOM 181602=DAOM 197198]